LVNNAQGSVTRRYVYDDDGRILGEYGASAADVKAEYLWLSATASNDNQGFGGDDGTGGYTPLAISTAPTGGSASLSWIHANHLGVPLTTTDATGLEIAAPSTATALGFPGQMKTLPDLWYNRHRDYDPTSGRYIQADPIGLEGDANPYGYAKANPLKYVDPDGKIAFVIPAAYWVGAAAAAGVTWAYYEWTMHNPNRPKGVDCAIHNSTNDQLSLLGKKPKGGRRRAPGIRCTSCDTWHGGSTGTTECRDCKGKRDQGYPVAGPKPRNLD
jgi:RHS repeat-associated protein